jgi:integrase
MVTDAPKVFGKFESRKPRKLREWEIYFRINDREGANGWKSQYNSVHNLLRHLRRYTQSTSTRSTYLRVLHRFCRYTGCDPDQLVGLPPKQVSGLIMDFVDELDEQQDYSKAYLNSIIRRLQTFFTTNEYEGLRVQPYFLPARYRKRIEYIPTKDEVFLIADAAEGLRNRALILSLWSSGLRISTLIALNIDDVQKELEDGRACIKIPVYPEMKDRVPDACKRLDTILRIHLCRGDKQCAGLPQGTEGANWCPQPRRTTILLRVESF